MISHIIIAAALVAVALDNLRLRYELQKRKRENATSVEAALSDRVIVDGIELPKPDDERWVLRTRKSVKSDENVDTLDIEPVWVSTQFVYVNTGGSSIENLPATGATKNYCTAVWKAYRSRVARKAIESA